MRRRWLVMFWGGTSLIILLSIHIAVGSELWHRTKLPNYHNGKVCCKWSCYKNGLCCFPQLFQQHFHAEVFGFLSSRCLEYQFDGWISWHILLNVCGVQFLPRAQLMCVGKETSQHWMKLVAREGHLLFNPSVHEVAGLFGPALSLQWSMWSKTFASPT